MKKTIKKLVASICLCAALVGVFGTTQYEAATTASKSINSSSKFNDNWELTVKYKLSDGTFIGQMVYGYDTWFMAEDYTWTVAEECYTTAQIKRNTVDTSYKSGAEIGKKAYSTIEVQHLNYSITYRIKFSATYGEIIAGTPTSSSVK